MQFFSRSKSNPKRREHGVTNFSLLQKKGYEFFAEHLRVWKCRVMFAPYKTLWHSVLRLQLHNYVAEVSSSI